MGIRDRVRDFLGHNAESHRKVDPEALADPVHIRVRDVHKSYGARSHRLMSSSIPQFYAICH